MRFLRKVIVIGLALFAGAYLVVLGLLYFNQRGMIYFPSGKSVAPPAEVKLEVVQFDTADGERLVAWWMPPRDETRPVILFFNGNNDSLGYQTGRFQRIAAQGVGMLAVAYRGYDGSTGTPTEAGLHQDAGAAYAWLAGRVPAERIVIHGFSLGTGVATRLAAEKPARALVLEAPYTAAVDLASEVYPWVPVRLLMHDKFLSRDRIGQVEEPVLIVHGDADSVIPFRHGQELFSKADQPKTFVRMVGSDHNTLTRDGLYDHLWRFLGLPFEGTTAYQGKAAQFEVVQAGG